MLNILIKNLTEISYQITFGVIILQRRSRSWSLVSVWSHMRDDRWSSVLSAKPGFISHVRKSARTMSLKCTHVSCVETPNSLPANQIVSELRITSLQRSRVPRQLSRSANGARCVKGAWERESARCWQCYFYDNKLICVQRFHQIILVHCL